MSGFMFFVILSGKRAARSEARSESKDLYRFVEL
jgi:hypothetical protein